MFPFSHAFAGFLIALGASAIGLPLDNTLVFTAVLGSLIPDMDVFWNKKLGDHHNSISHTPLTWIIISTGVYFFQEQIGIILLVSTLTHLGCDYVTGRTIGIPLLYPLESKQFSLYPLKPENGEFNILKPDKEKLKTHLSYYLENKDQLVFELGVNILGFCSMLIVLTQL